MTRKPPADIDFTLRRVFKKKSFRPLQREVIIAALEGNDVFLQAATSFGKSICYQLPALVDHGITIVVSPLLALMSNQVETLHRAGIDTAKVINSNTPRSVRDAILRDLECGHPRNRLLYVTPEYCTFDNFRRHLHTVHKHRELARIAIDEAHCISEWGHDFRPSFKELKYFRQNFPDVPIMCLTATATKRVRDDIIQILGLETQKLRVFSMTTSRCNLHYEVRFKSDDVDHFDDFLSWLKAVHRRRKENSTRSAELATKEERLDAVSGIIYTLYRNGCEALASRLCSHGIGAKPFHAGLSLAEKEDALRGWIAGEEGYDIIVATTAFGMGIDKMNVRFVVHWQIPKSFEGFYQEAGRAGRDQKASICILYYGREDRDRTASLIARDNGNSKNIGPGISRAKSFQALIDYCENTSSCRHKLICDYFGEARTPDCDFACDWHKDPHAIEKAKRDGLASEEWCMTQRETGAYDDNDCY